MLKIFKRHDSQFYWIRGTIFLNEKESVRIRQSSKCTDRRSAELQAQAIEQRIKNDYRNKSFVFSVSFRDATVAYVTRKGELHPEHSTRLGILNDYFGSADVSQIDGRAFQSFCDRYLKGKSGAYINRWRSDLVSVINFTRDNNPKIQIHKIPKREVPFPKPRYLTSEEQERLLNAYEPIVRPIVDLLCFQGSRIGEAICLQWRDVDLDGRRITFWDTKNRDFRTVPMHTRVCKSLRSIDRERDGSVFLTHLGLPYTYTKSASSSTIKTAHRTALRRARITNFKIHNWRSHWASRMALKGANVYELMSLGGWRDAKSVAHYVKLNPDGLRSAIDRLN